VSTATALADALATLSEPLKGLLLVTNPVSFNCDTLLAALHQAAPGIALFGGGAGNFDFAHTIAFSRQGYSETAVIAVALCGGTLEILRRAYLGWVPVGKRMRVTKTNGFYVETIDDQPAFEVYQRYLGPRSRCISAISESTLQKDSGSTRWNSRCLSADLGKPWQAYPLMWVTTRRF
jgi:hypothetical protein